MLDRRLMCRQLGISLTNADRAEIDARLAGGEDFMALMAEYGEDPGMQNEPTATRGYYVSAKVIRRL